MDGRKRKRGYNIRLRRGLQKLLFKLAFYFRVEGGKLSYKLANAPVMLRYLAVLIPYTAMLAAPLHRGGLYPQMLGRGLVNASILITPVVNPLAASRIFEIIIYQTGRIFP